tara:strand:- start:1235 stop:1537 length:303 start_codon:yes stop_codon:yes gene_type:complete
MYQPKDVTGQLSEYIRKNLAKGYNQDTLKFSLMSQGYSRITVENALEKANKELATKIEPVKEKPRITYTIVDEQNRPIKTVNLPEEKSKGFFSKLKEIFE